MQTAGSLGKPDKIPVIFLLRAKNCPSLDFVKLEIKKASLFLSFGYNFLVVSLRRCLVLSTLEGFASILIPAVSPSGDGNLPEQVIF